MIEVERELLEEGGRWFYSETVSAPRGTGAASAGLTVDGRTPIEALEGLADCVGGNRILFALFTPQEVYRLTRRRA